MQTSLLKPKIIAVESLGENHARVVMEPFERGYGHTFWAMRFAACCCRRWLATRRPK